MQYDCNYSIEFCRIESRSAILYIYSPGGGFLITCKLGITTRSTVKVPQWDGICVWESSYFGWDVVDHTDQSSGGWMSGFTQEKYARGFFSNNYVWSTMVLKKKNALLQLQRKSICSLCSIFCLQKWLFQNFTNKWRPLRMESQLENNFNKKWINI